MKGAQKLYAYVDESGQDTRGRMFVGGIVVLEQEREKIGQELERIEEQSGKRIKKWHKASHDHRIAYFEDITRSRVFHDTLFFEIFTESRKYIEMTSYATAKAILKKASGDNYTATIFIDGFRKREIEVFTHGLRDLHIKRRKVRGVKKRKSAGGWGGDLTGLPRDPRRKVGVQLGLLCITNNVAYEVIARKRDVVRRAGFEPA